MEEYERCSRCGKPYAEHHHIIFRSQSKFLENSPVDIMFLCSECHRGNNGPHKNRKIDLQYKRELKNRLEKMFSKDYYTEKEIKDRLQITDSAIRKMLKILTRYKEGYLNTDIVKRCLGG